MRFPTYKIHSLVRLFHVRMLRFDLLEYADLPVATWGRSAAHNAWRYERISNLPLKTHTLSPWRHIVMHEIVYFNRRIKIYKARWQKCYEQCMLTLSRPLVEHISVYASLWQIVAFNEASRLNTNFLRKTGNSRIHPLTEWQNSYEFNAHLLNQVLPPSSKEKSAWDLAYSAILRSSFRQRRFEWQSHNMFRGRR